MNPGHALLVPRRHVATWEEASTDERRALSDAIVVAQEEIRKHHRPNAFNVGMNLGLAAGADRAASPPAYYSPLSG